MHEEDTSTAWKHVEYRGNGRNDMRRGRRLVLQFVATVANYDYIFCTVSSSLCAECTKLLSWHLACKIQMVIERSQQQIAKLSQEFDTSALFMELYVFIIKQAADTKCSLLPVAETVVFNLLVSPPLQVLWWLWWFSCQSLLSSADFGQLISCLKFFLFLQYLQTDGTMQYEAKLTGCLSTSIMSEGEGDKPWNGSLMSLGLNAQIHQHFFCVRIDPAIDCEEGGNSLVVTEVISHFVFTNSIV